jgi:hypothetical protein
MKMLDYKTIGRRSVYVGVYICIVWIMFVVSPTLARWTIIITILYGLWFLVDNWEDITKQLEKQTGLVSKLTAQKIKENNEVDKAWQKLKQKIKKNR